MTRILSLLLLVLSCVGARGQGQYVITSATPASLVTNNPAGMRLAALTNGAGLFRYDPSSSATTNTTEVFKPANSNGRWIRVDLPGTSAADRLATNNGTAYALGLGDATPSRAAAIGSDGKLTNATPTLAELNYIAGLTARAQDQLNERMAKTNGSGFGNFTIQGVTNNGIWRFLDTAQSPKILSGHISNTNEATSGAIVIGGGYTNFPNRILGSTSDLTSIVGGYDDTIKDSLASQILGVQHGYIEGGSHGLLVGGSYNTNLFSDYSGILSGTLNLIKTDSDKAVIVGGSESTIDEGSEGSAIVGGRLHWLDGLFAGIWGGDRNTNTGNFATVLGGLQNNNNAASAVLIGHGINNAAGAQFIVGGFPDGIYLGERSGNVAIGYTNDTAIPSKLTIKASSSGSTQRIEGPGDGTGDNHRWGIAWAAGNVADSDVLFKNSPTQSSPTFPWGKINGMHMRYLDSFTFGMGVSSTNYVMRLDSSGRVGINRGTAETLGNILTLVPLADADGIRMFRYSDGAQNGSLWYASILQNAGATDSAGFGHTSSAYTTGGTFSALGNDETFLRFPNKLTLFQGTDSAPNLHIDTLQNIVFGGRSVGNGAVGNVVLNAGTAPSSRPADLVSVWAEDQSGAGTAALHIGGEGSPVVTHSFGQKFVSGGGRKTAFASWGTDHSVQTYEHGIRITATSTQTLPNASDSGAGTIFFITADSGVTGTLAAGSGDTVNGAATLTLSAGDAVQLVSDGGTNWKIKARYYNATTGSGALVFGTDPTLVAPNIGVATGTSLAVDTEAYDATGWDGDLTVPTKKAVRDKIESMSAGGGGIAGTVVNSGTIADGNIPQMSANTNLVTSPVNVTGGTNITVTGKVHAHGVVVTNFIAVGGETSSHAGLKGSGSSVQIRNGDDSGFGVGEAHSFAAQTSGAFYWNTRGQIFSPADGKIQFLNWASTGFDMLLFGPATTSFPALKRSGAGLVARLADDSANAALTAESVTVDAETYDASGWDGDSTVPTKNDVRDKIESSFKDPRDGYVIIDHFLGVNLANGQNGDTTWVNASAGSGSGPTVSGFVPAASHHGQLHIRTGTTTTGVGIIQKNASSMYLGDGEVTQEFVIYIPDLSTVGEEFIIRIGLGDASTNADHVDGVYLEYDRLSSANWRAKTSSNSSRTATNTSTAVAEDTWIRGTITANSAGTSVAFYIDGTLVHTETTNIPTGTSRTLAPHVFIGKSAGTTTRGVIVDYSKTTHSFATQIP